MEAPFTSRKRIICDIFSFIMMLIFIMLIFFSPISKIIYGAEPADFVCDGNIVNMNTWLIIQGVVGLFSLIFILPIRRGEKDVTLLPIKCGQITYIILYIFRVSWLIIGSVTFWHSCDKFSTGNTKGFMYFALITEYLCIVLINPIFFITASKDDLSESTCV